MTGCPKCAAPLLTGVCEHCGWSPPSRGVLVRFADTLPEAIALPQPDRQLSPGVDYPVDQRQGREYIELAVLAGAVVTILALVLISIDFVFGLIHHGIANVESTGFWLNGAALAFWLFVARCLMAIGDWASDINREYESFTAYYHDLLHRARTKRLLNNDDTLVRYARNHPDAVLAREEEFLARSDELEAELEGRFYNFVVMQPEGDEILAYTTELRRFVQAAYFFKSLLTANDLARAKGEQHQITENAKARIGTLAKVDLKAEVDQKLERIHAQKQPPALEY